jgi:hypothetical protein
MVFREPILNESDSFKFMETSNNELKHPNPYCDDFRFQREERAEKEVPRRQVREPANLYRNYCPEQISKHSEYDEPPRR